MTDETKLALLKSMTDETDEDTLSAFLDIAREIILVKAFPYSEDPVSETLPPKYDHLQVEIAAYMLNKRGADYETVHLEGSVSRHWEDGAVPGSLLRRITPMVGVL